MNSIFAVLALVALIALPSAAAYLVTSETFTASNTVVYFPSCNADENGECGSPLAAGLTFPGVIFLQGGSVDASAYSTYVSKLAAEGYIVAVPNAPVTFTQFGQRVQQATPFIALGAKNLLISLNGNAASGIFGRLTPDNFALVGHSLGGVIAIITGSNDAATRCRPPGPGGPPGDLFFVCAGYQGFGSGLKAVVTYGSSLFFRQGPIAILFNTDTTGVPNVLIRGKADGRVPRINVTATYDSSLELPKAFIELDFANHFGITDSQEIPFASTDPSPQSKSQDWSTSQITKITKDALDAHCLNDHGALDKIYGRLDLGPSFITVAASQLA
jgi:fermentation-respiration switch protein FrsA (DUF1100 family)